GSWSGDPRGCRRPGSCRRILDFVRKIQIISLCMQKHKVAWSGVFPAAITAFTPAQAVDRRATAAHLEGLVRTGVHGLIVLGTVGENSSLDVAEKLDVLRTAVEAVDRRAPVRARVAP